MPVVRASPLPEGEGQGEGLNASSKSEIYQRPAPMLARKEIPQLRIFKCPMHAPFIPTLAAAILDGSIWHGPAPKPHELPGLTVYLPGQAAVEPLKLAFLAQSPNGATFLPRIRVLGEADPLDLFAAYGPRMAPAAALELLEDALAVPPAFGELERRVQLAALVMNASQALLGTRLAHEPMFTPITPASAFTIAGQIAALIGEAHEAGADLALVGQLDSSRASGSEQLSIQLLRKVLRGWEAHKAKTGKLDSEERRNQLMAIEGEFVRQADAPVIIAGSTGSVVRHRWPHAGRARPPAIRNRALWARRCRGGSRIASRASAAWIKTAPGPF